MKRNILIIAAFVGSLLFASCGENTDAKFMKQADDMFAQAETDLQGINDIDAFFDFYADLQTKKDNLAMESMKAYAQDDTTATIPEEVRTHIFDRASQYNKVEAEKYAELISPFVDRLENALNAQDKEEAENALEALMPYAMYDNVLPELQERFEGLIEKAEELGIE